MLLVDLLVVLIIAGVVLWAAKALMGAFGLGEPIHTVVYVLLVLVLLVMVLNVFGLGPNLGVGRLRY